MSLCISYKNDQVFCEFHFVFVWREGPKRILLTVKEKNITISIKRNLVVSLTFVLKISFQCYKALVCVCVCVCVCIYIYIYIHTHMSVCTYRYSLINKCSLPSF